MASMTPEDAYEPITEVVGKDAIVRNLYVKYRQYNRKRNICSPLRLERHSNGLDCRH